MIATIMCALSQGPEGIKRARAYEQKMIAAGVTQTTILRRAAEIRDDWAKLGLYHTNNATSILLAAIELNQRLS